MKIEVDPRCPANTLNEISWQLSMLSELLSQGDGTGVLLSEEALCGMCGLLRAMGTAVDQVATLATPAAPERKAA